MSADEFRRRSAELAEELAAAGGVSRAVELIEAALPGSGPR